MKTRKIKFICQAYRWFDNVNGNTYHSVRVTRCRDGAIIAGEWEYGYDEQYKATTLILMAAKKWLPLKYRGKDNREHSTPNYWVYERENNYPIEWNVTDGLKRDMVANGQI